MRFNPFHKKKQNKKKLISKKHQLRKSQIQELEQLIKTCFIKMLLISNNTSYLKETKRKKKDYFSKYNQETLIKISRF